jgi:hypothetical protein
MREKFTQIAAMFNENDPESVKFEPPTPVSNLATLLCPIFQKTLEARDIVDFIIRSVNVNHF